MRCTPRDPWLSGASAGDAVDSVAVAGDRRDMGTEQVPTNDPAFAAAAATNGLLQGHRNLVRSACAIALAAVVAGCAPTITKHGHQFQDNDVQKVQVGMSQQQVAGVLGTPTTTAAIASGQAHYYIASTEKQTAFFTPEETDRKVLAIYYSQYGAVERVGQYGLKDGKVINYSKNQTPNSAREDSVIKSLFRNLGSKQLFGE